MDKKANIPSGERLLVLTREMLAFAEAGKWEQLGELEQTRLPLFNEVFADGISDNLELAQEILLLDEKTKGLAEAEMTPLRQEMLKMRKSGQANNAYQVVQGLSSGNR